MFNTRKNKPTKMSHILNNDYISKYKKKVRNVAGIR